MARSRRTRRDTSAIANRRLPRSQTPSVSPRSMQSDFLRSVSDGRFFNPEPLYASPKTLSGARHRLRVFSPTSVSRSHPARPGRGFRAYEPVPTAIGFENPSQMVTCVRRGIREEVLHAKRKTGRVGQKRPRFNEFSKVRCK